MQSGKKAGCLLTKKIYEQNRISQTTLYTGQQYGIL